MKPNILIAFILCSLGSLCLSGEAFASLDPELRTPYTLKVVLHFADNRLLTHVFRDRVKHELHDELQASFGDLVNVEEVTFEHPRLYEILQNGLKSLDGWRERSQTKTHFVLIDYSGVHYEIQTRQFDGLTGRPSPVVRKDRTRDREFVAKAAALLIDQDFGLVGTFDVWPEKFKDLEDKLVVVNLKGGSLGAPLDRWIKKGDVFAVVQMPFDAAASGKPVPDAILQVETPPAGADSTCQCRPFRRYEAPKATSGAGYRCFKLGTITGPLFLRLRKAITLDRSGEIDDALSVQIRRHGFDDEEMTVLHKQTDVLGAVDTAGEKDGVFTNVAFVTVVSSDAKGRADIPVAILDDQPVVLAVNVTDDAGSKLIFQKSFWERDVNFAWQEQNELFREINEGVAKTEDRPAFMKKIEERWKRLQNEVDNLTARQAQVKPGSGDQDVVDRLNKVRKGQAELTDYLAKLKAIDAAENDPQLKKWKAEIAEGQQLEAELELAKAIEKYDQMKDRAPNDTLKATLETHLAALRKTWEPKSEAHREARAFIYDVWPKLDNAGLLEKLPEARKAYEVCKQFNDNVGLIQLSKATEAHAVRMGQELTALKPDINIDDEKQAKIIQDVSKGLADLARDVHAALATAAPAGK